jgi:hypothetical protein
VGQAMLAMMLSPLLHLGSDQGHRVCGYWVLSLLDECIYAVILEEVGPSLRDTDVRITLADGHVQKCAGRTTLLSK